MENLFKIRSYSYNNTVDVRSDMFIHYTVLKIMNICILEIKFARVASANVLIPAQDMPVEFRPLRDVLLSGTVHHGISMDYHWLRLTPQGKFYTHNDTGETIRNMQTTIVYETKL